MKLTTKLPIQNSDQWMIIINLVGYLWIGAFAWSRPKFLKDSVASTRTHGRGEETQLSSGWTLIGSELSSPNFNSVRAERYFAICYPNKIIKPLSDNLGICLNYYFWSRNSVRVLSVADRDRKWKMPFWMVLFGRALEQFSRFRDRNPILSPKSRARECTYCVPFLFAGHLTILCSESLELQAFAVVWCFSFFHACGVAWNYVKRPWLKA